MDAATAGIVGAAVGGSIAVVGSLAAVVLQIKDQRARDQADRLVGHRREFAAPLDQALGELIALAIRAVPKRQQELDEVSLDPDTWPKDWKSMRQEQDQLRDKINRLALMSPYSSTVQRTRTLVERLDEFSKAESNQAQFYEEPSDQDSDEVKKDWLRRRDSGIQTLDEAQKALLEATYSLRRHLELLISRPESDPDSAG